MGEDRRVTDRDHDLLVQLGRDMSHLCHKFDKNHEEVREDIKEVHNRIDKQADGCKATHTACSSFFVPRYVFYWAVVLCFVTLTFVGGVALTNQNKIHKHDGFSTEANKQINNRLNDLQNHVWHPEESINTIPDYVSKQE